MKLKLQVESCRLQVFENLRRGRVSTFNLQPSTFNRCAAFTLVEIAISLAVIGIALVAIIGVLPWGMNAQRDNRERTVIGQDATIFMQAIRDGARGNDDLTNYVYEIQVGNSTPVNPNSGAEIIGLLSTTNSVNYAYVRSISGPAVEKPPQDNGLVVDASFSYQVACENTPVPTADNSAYARQLTNNLHELRLTFLWPILPNGQLPSRPASQTFRILIAGQIAQDASNTNLYFFQPQSFTNSAP